MGGGGGGGGAASAREVWGSIISSLGHYEVMIFQFEKKLLCSTDSPNCGTEITIMQHLLYVYYESRSTENERGMQA